MPNTAPPAPENSQTDSESASLVNDQERRNEDRKTSRIVIFTILFGFTGALGLPLLWFSRSFTIQEKLVWSLINTLYTLALIAGTVAICFWSFHQITGRSLFEFIPDLKLPLR